MHGPAHVFAQNNPLDGFDQLVEQAPRDWNAPGPAVAILQVDPVILLQGHSYRDVEKKIPIMSKALFVIASITKSFAVTDLGTLIDGGAVRTTQ